MDIFLGQRLGEDENTFSLAFTGNPSYPSDSFIHLLFRFDQQRCFQLFKDQLFALNHKKKLDNFLKSVADKWFPVAKLNGRQFLQD
jgi:hypothetical protein